MKRGNDWLKLSALAAAIVSVAHSETEVVPHGTFVGDGQTLDVINDDQIETQGQVTVADGGDAVFWSATKIVLKPNSDGTRGFWATPDNSGFFMAAIDSDFDGYTDVEEAIDSDGDGMFDLWEIAHGLNPFSNSDAGANYDGDSYTNLQEFQQNRDPWANDNQGWFSLPTSLVGSSGGSSFMIVDPSGTFHGVVTPQLTLTSN